MAVYEIKLAGKISETWAEAWFGDMEAKEFVTPDKNTDTILTGNIPDQSALYGLISRIGSLGLTLLSVRKMD